MKNHHAIYMIVFSLILSSCSLTRTLEQGETLYKGDDVEVEGEKFLKKKRLESNLSDQVRPEPNKKLFGFIPFSLWAYNLAGDSVPKKGFRHWLQTKAGQPPVIYSPDLQKQSEEKIESYLLSKGYFHPDVDSKAQTKNKKTKVVFKVHPNKRFFIDTVAYPSKKDTLTKYIDSTYHDRLIKEGDPYDFADFKKERERITSYLKEHGYYSFNSDYLIFLIDSNRTENNLKVYLRVKENVPQKGRIQYNIRDIQVYPDYTLGNQNDLKYDTVIGGEMYYIYKESEVKPATLDRAILFEPGDLYKYSKYRNTLNKLMGLGIYKYANIEYNTLPTGDTNQLLASVYLTPTKPKSARVELQAVTKSNDFAGPALNFTYRDRNFLGGAEMFLFSIKTAYETQISGEEANQNTFEAGAETRLSIPRFIFPFIDFNKSLADRYTPKTDIELGYSYLFRSKYYTMNKSDASFGYRWRETVSSNHEFTLLNLNYNRITNRSEEFDSIISQTAYLAESFKEQLLFGLKYSYIHNDQLEEKKTVNQYFNFNTEFTGNTLSLTQLILKDKKPDNDNPYEILGIEYSQFSKFGADYRAYWNIDQEQQLVWRFFGGIGIAYGNSSVLPYFKQFYTGGPSNNRAFPSRSVGPGDYTPTEEEQRLFFDFTGDIKLETNLEYRFPVISVVKGAVFTDVGNVWLRKKNAKDYPDGVFQTSQILDELAIGTGIGLRIDASFFVVRFDLAFPLRDPALPEGNRWMMDDIDFADSKWRKQNLILNFAIGYPF
jgi:outer membrane protein assembly factor BamA